MLCPLYFPVKFWRSDAEEFAQRARTEERIRLGELEDRMEEGAYDQAMFLRACSVALKTRRTESRKASTAGHSSSRLQAI